MNSPRPNPAPALHVTATPAPAHLSLHIDELVLHGVAPAAGHAVSAAFQDALRPLLADARLLQRLARMEPLDQLSLEDVRLANGASPAALGRALAAALHARLLLP